MRGRCGENIAHRGFPTSVASQALRANPDNMNETALFASVRMRTLEISRNPAVRSRPRLDTFQQCIDLEEEGDDSPLLLAPDMNTLVPAGSPEQRGARTWNTASPVTLVVLSSEVPACGPLQQQANAWCFNAPPSAPHSRGDVMRRARIWPVTATSKPMVFQCASLCPPSRSDVFASIHVALIWRCWLFDARYSNALGPE